MLNDANSGAQIKTKPLFVIIGFLTLIIISTIFWLAVSIKKSGGEENREIGKKASEALSALENSYILPSEVPTSENPIKQVLPKENPIEKTNPFKNTYQNPFE